MKETATVDAKRLGASTTAIAMGLLQRHQVTCVRRACSARATHVAADDQLVCREHYRREREERLARLPRPEPVPFGFTSSGASQRTGTTTTDRAFDVFRQPR